MIFDGLKSDGLEQLKDITAVKNWDEKTPPKKSEI